jgi:hypothetical protein
LITFPHAHHVAARRIHDLAALLLDPRERRHVGAESRHDHHIICQEVMHLRLLVFAEQVLDPERHDLLVDFRVVDDLSEDEQAPVLEDLGRRIREIDRPLDAVAKAKLLRETHRHAFAAQRPTGRTQSLDDLAAIVVLDLRLHLFHHLRVAEVGTDRLGGSGGFRHAT